MIGKRKIFMWDIGNVIIKPVHGSLIKKLYDNRDICIPHEQFKKSIAEILDKSFYGEINEETTWQDMFRVVNIHDDNLKKSIRNSVKSYKNSELIDYIKDLNNERFESGIISDLSQIGYGTLKREVGELLSLCSPQSIFISVEQQLSKRKDKEKLFEKILENVNYSPSNIVYVDDQEENIEYARVVGITSILFQGYDDGWSNSNKLLKERLNSIIHGEDE